MESGRLDSERIGRVGRKLGLIDFFSAKRDVGPIYMIY